MAKRGFEALQDVEIAVQGNETLLANSGILAGASPVFAAMLTSDMVEGRTKKIKLQDKTKEAIEMFLEIIHPAKGRLTKVTQENIDHLLPLFEEYQVEGFKDECESILMLCPASVDRLLLADRFGMQKALDHIFSGLVRSFPAVDTDRLCDMPHLMRAFMRALKKSVLCHTEDFGIDQKSIQLVENGALCSRAEAVKALIVNRNSVVDAVLSSIVRP